MSVVRVTTPSGTDFRTQVPNPKNDNEMRKAIQDITHFPIVRCFQEVVVVDSENYTVIPERDRVILASDSDTVGGGVTITLPDPANADSVEYVVRNTDMTTAITVDSVSGSVEGGALGTTSGGRWATDGTDYWLTGIYP